jgi:hypothetical protein
VIPILYETVKLFYTAQLKAFLECFPPGRLHSSSLSFIKNFAIGPVVLPQVDQGENMYMLYDFGGTMKTALYLNLAHIRTLLAEMTQLEQLWIKPSGFLCFGELWDGSSKNLAPVPRCPRFTFLPGAQRPWQLNDEYAKGMVKALRDFTFEITHLCIFGGDTHVAFRDDIGLLALFPKLTHLAWRDVYDLGPNAIQNRSIPRSCSGIFTVIAYGLHPQMELVVFCLQMTGVADPEASRKAFVKDIGEVAHNSWLDGRVRWVLLAEGTAKAFEPTIAGKDIWARGEHQWTMDALPTR